MKTATSLVFSLLLIAPLLVAADSLDYRIEKGQFATSEGIIPPSCIGRMMTELNGDNFIAAIYLNRNSMRGCISSNYAGNSNHNAAYTYKIHSEVAPHTYNLVVCEKIEGSVGKSCDQITVEFISIPYTVNTQKQMTTGLLKLGEWED